MTTEEENLVLDNQKLACDIAWKHYKKYQGLFDVEELKSVALLGLSKSAVTFDKNLGNAFTTYAYKVITNEIVRFVASENKHKLNISIFENLSDTIEIQDTLKSDYDLFIHFDSNYEIAELKKEIDKLEDRYRLIINYYLEGKTQKEIGQIIGLSQAQVATLYNKALNMLRYRLRFLRG